MTKHPFKQHTEQELCQHGRSGNFGHWQHLATSLGLLYFYCPLVICLVLDALGNSVPRKIGEISALLVSIQCVINPFIYALRFKELRQAMKQIFCCKKKAEGQFSANIEEIVERSEPMEQEQNV